MPRGSSDPAAEKDKQIGQRVLGALLSSSFAFATRFSFVKYNIAVKYDEIVSPQVLYPRSIERHHSLGSVLFMF
jgi:hypothetical protein